MTMRAAIAAESAALPGFADPADAAATLALLRHLHAVGRRDVPLGRLFEGHVDALQIVMRYADPALAADVAAAARQGATFGVWNADPSEGRLRYDGDRLSGAKSYASGAGELSHALVTADGIDGRRLFLVDLAAVPPRIDRDWWKVVGMQRSETHLVSWEGSAAAVPIGAPGDYARDPWFGGGALRFVAVQAGAVAGIHDATRTHLVGTGRAGDPHQVARLATLYALAQAAADTVASTAAAWFAVADPVRLARVAAARLQVADCGERAILLAQQAVGLQGLFVGHPLAAMLTDLMVYLRQPAPDAARARVGTAVADGILSPAL